MNLSATLWIGSWKYKKGSGFIFDQFFFEVFSILLIYQ
jgi:hypothetical protein